jgi:protein-S-isoprenylcysteine O-methyltransferase Ste14
MSDFFAPFIALPGYGIGALLALILYAIQSEVRFGKRARAMRAGPSDRWSTQAVSLAAAVPVLGFALAMKARSSTWSFLPHWFRNARLPAMPAIAWFGVLLAFSGIALRLWAVLTLRDRYTRTLLIQDEQKIERRGPYRWVRHPGYLGSLLCLNGVALASGNAVTLVASLVVTLAAYSYRIKVEDQMLVAAFGDSYDQYRRETHALLPTLRSDGMKPD